MAHISHISCQTKSTCYTKVCLSPMQSVPRNQPRVQHLFGVSNSHETEINWQNLKDKIFYVDCAFQIFTRITRLQKKYSCASHNEILKNADSALVMFTRKETTFKGNANHCLTKPTCSLLEIMSKGNVILCLTTPNCRLMRMFWSRPKSGQK